MKEVANHLQSAGAVPTREPVIVSVEFVFRLPTSLPKSERFRLDKQPKATKPDIDNLLKMLFDAGHERLWCDDGQIVGVTAMKSWTTAGRGEIRLKIYSGAEILPKTCF